MSKNETFSNLIATAISDESLYHEYAPEIIKEINNDSYRGIVLSTILSYLKSLKEIKNSKEDTHINYFLALLLLKECMDSTSIKLANDLNLDKSIIKRLGDIAKFDANNSDIERGRAIFGGKSPNLGSKYLKLALECIFTWQKKFKSDDKNPTVFTEVYQNLIKAHVTFPRPEEFIFCLQKSKKKPPVAAAESINTSSKVSNPPAKNSTPSGFGNPGGNDKSKLLQEKQDLPNILRQIVETLQETVLVNEDLSEFMNETLIGIVKELQQLDQKYETFINEAFQTSDILTENELNKFIEEKDFIAPTIDDINFVLKKLTNEEYKRFLTKTKTRIEKTFHIYNEKTGTPANNYPPKPESKKILEKPEHFSPILPPKRTSGILPEKVSAKLPEKQSQSYFPDPQEHHKRPSEEFNFHDFKPKAEDYGTFGNGNDPQQDGFAFHEFSAKNDKIHNDAKAQKTDNSDIWKSGFSGNNEAAFENFSQPMKTSQKNDTQMKMVTSERMGVSKDSKYKKGGGGGFNEIIHEEPHLSTSHRSAQGNSNRNVNDQKENLVETRKITFDNKKVDNRSNIQQSQINRSRQNTNPNNTVQRGYNFPEAEGFEEKFDNLSVSTLSVRDFPFKNKVLKDPQRKTPGKLIPYNTSLFELEYLRDSSNLRKFKQACLKTKCPLFEIPNLQIGVVTSTFFDIPSSKNFLKMSLFYGNKSKYGFEHFSVDYTGDYSFSLWLKPENNTRTDNDENDVATIAPKSQIKHEMIINYNSTPLTIIMAEIEMKSHEERLSFPVYLPLLITKFFVLKSCDSKVFKFKWKIKKEYRLRSDIFTINPKILRHPSYLKRYFPECCEITALKDFISQTKDSEYIDYKVGLVFELNKPDIEYIMKFVLRPNMTMYVQISSPPNYTAICEYILQNIYFIFSK